uniref:C-type lectin domain-containing protein n=2 Tax=Eptatretus burgeri TaxID=7764 RepID=A0A8C4NL54_EPTBU
MNCRPTFNFPAEGSRTKEVHWPRSQTRRHQIFCRFIYLRWRLKMKHFSLKLINQTTGLVTWCGSHIGKTDKLWASIPETTPRKKLKFGTSPTRVPPSFTAIYLARGMSLRESRLLASKGELFGYPSSFANCVEMHAAAGYNWNDQQCRANNRHNICQFVWNNGTFWPQKVEHFHPPLPFLFK